MRRMKVLIKNLMCLLLLISRVSAAEPATSYADKEDFLDYISELSAIHGFSSEYLSQVFSGIEPSQRILDLISKPSEKRLEWFEYQKILVDEPRIRLGVEFWKENLDTLIKAERIYGVAPEYIVAIIGVETRYGRIMGSYPVLQALTTLGFSYPPRSKFFLKELTEFFLLTRSQKLNPLTLAGSYAGAMGYGQFMPSSYRAYAVDFDGDNIKDIWNNKADAIGSVANYFSRHGWKGEGPVVLRGQKIFENVLAESDKSLAPNITAGSLREKGIDSPLSSDTEVALFLMQGIDGEEYWLGLNDFYVITRYNHSSMYALAVYQLSQAIKERRRKLSGS